MFPFYETMYLHQEQRGIHEMLGFIVLNFDNVILIIQGENAMLFKARLRVFKFKEFLPKYLFYWRSASGASSEFFNMRNYSLPNKILRQYFCALNTSFQTVYK